MKRQTAVRQLFLNRAPLLVALFSILVPGRLIALDLDLRRVGGYDTSGSALGAAIVVVSSVLTLKIFQRRLLLPGLSKDIQNLWCD